MTEQEVLDLLLDIRFFATDLAEGHDPYEQCNEIVSYIDERMKEI